MDTSKLDSEDLERNILVMTKELKEYIKAEGSGSTKFCREYETFLKKTFSDMKKICKRLQRFQEMVIYKYWTGHK